MIQALKGNSDSIFFVNAIMEKTPDSYKSPLQEITYKSLAKLQVSLLLLWFLMNIV